ncbi:hypothetical protein ACFQVC_03275 [Streptomyces monticola]|uniref:DUF3558 domain-containing protein n=1 Tax=Streptomyces monticola TaxID=2666263 RepID=A0ABW2JB79_9ACTN
MRSLPLLLAGRLLPVAVLATGGWAWTTGPGAPADEPAVAAARSAQKPEPEPVHRKPPAPCEALTKDTVGKLAPEADRDGKELRLTDPDRRRTCSWSALKGYDYRWLDVSYDLHKTVAAARQAYPKRGADGDPVPDLGDKAAVTVDLTTKDRQETREATVVTRSRNALVTVTYNGSDFESKGAPKAEAMQEGAVRAAREAVSRLTDTAPRN